MVRLYDANNPFWKGRARIDFYEGHLIAQDAHVETDKTLWVNVLLARGWKIEEDAEPVTVQAPTLEAPPESVKSRRTPPRRSSQEVLNG